MVSQPYSAIAIANAFLVKAHECGITLTHMKLQKLIYFAQAFHLAVMDSALFRDKIYAWPYGPVVESVYHEFKGFGSAPINSLGTEYTQPNPERLDDFGTLIVPMIPEEDGLSLLVVEEIWAKYGHMNAAQLSEITHEGHTPWGKTASQHNNGRIRNYELTQPLIQESMKTELNSRT